MFFSVCVPAVFPKQPMQQMLLRVRKAGYRHFEFWSWWDQDIDALESAMREADVIPAALCTRFVSLTDPAQRDEYLRGLADTVALCRRLGCPVIISQVGAERPGVPRRAQHDSLVEGLMAAAPLLDGQTLVIEPLNTKIDHPGYYLSASAEAFEIVEEVNHPRVKVLFDLYHQYITEGLDIADIVGRLPRIGHFHMAGYPGRHEPLSDSEIDYPAILRAIKDAGYAHGVGLEYSPARDADEGLRALAALPL